MANISSDLAWELLKNNASYLIRRDGQTFSREPYNLLNRHSKRFSPSISSQAIGVEFSKTGKVDVVYKSSRKNKANRPSKLYKKRNLKRDVRRIARTINRETNGRHFRGDLTKFALARLTKINAANKRIQKKK